MSMMTTYDFITVINSLFAPCRRCIIKMKFIKIKATSASLMRLKMREHNIRRATIVSHRVIVVFEMYYNRG